MRPRQAGVEAHFPWRDGQQRVVEVRILVQPAIAHRLSISHGRKCPFCRCWSNLITRGHEMRTKTLLVAMVLGWLVASADAHFVLVSPAPSIVQNRLGDPQKLAPCGGVSANPGRGTPANPGTPSGTVTEIKGGSSFHVLVSETVFHPGHYRVALARTAANLP